MKRIVSVFLTAVLLLTALAGCGSAETTPAESAATPAPTEAPTPEPTAEPVEIRLGALTGPTAMGMVKLLSDADADAAANDYTYTLAGAADELTPLLLQGQLDIAAVPSNLASVLYNKTEGQIQTLAVNTLGVLYVVEMGGESVQSFADLRGQTIYATGKGAVPEYFLRYLLTENGLDPDADVTIEWKSEPAEVVALMSTADHAVAMLPQPYVTVAQNTLGEDLRVALSLTEGWDALDNGSRCTTAVIVVRRDFAEAHPDAVAAFLEEYAASTAWVNENVADAAALCEQYNIVKAPVAQKAIPYCSIVCITGSEMQEALSGCLAVLYDLNPSAVGGALPGSDFYYGA